MPLLEEETTNNEGITLHLPPSIEDGDQKDDKPRSEALRLGKVIENQGALDHEKARCIQYRRYFKDEDQFDWFVMLPIPDNMRAPLIARMVREAHPLEPHWEEQRRPREEITDALMTCSKRERTQ